MNLNRNKRKEKFQGEQFIILKSFGERSAAPLKHFRGPWQRATAMDLLKQPGLQIWCNWTSRGFDPKR